MQITWLLGNGFDKSFGLKTDYMDFYNYLINNESNLNVKDNIIYKKLKDDFNNAKNDEWKDYEFKLGKMTKNFDESNIEQFVNDKLDLDDCLRLFLENSTKENLKLTDEQILKILSNSFQDITKDVKRIEREKIYSIFQLHRNEPFRINSISFNYTNTVSMIFMETNETKKIKIAKMPDHPYTIIISDPFYIHGTLDNDEMIIGVDNEKQIVNITFSKSKRVQEALLKNQLLDIAGQNNFKKYTDIIFDSNIICLFGLSIGPTDKAYWEVIKKQLLKENVLLIIYWYDNQVERLNIIRRNDYNNLVKELFFDSSNATKEEIEKISSKILVEINHNIFGNQKEE